MSRHNRQPRGQHACTTPARPLRPDEASALLSLFLAGRCICCPTSSRYVCPHDVIDDPRVALAVATFWYEGLGCVDLPFADGDAEPPPDDDPAALDDDEQRGAARARRYFAALLESVDPEAAW